MRRVLFFVFILQFSSSLSSQTVLYRDHSLGLTIPEIALIDIEPDNSTINLSFNLPTEAGLPIVSIGTSTTSKWINYTNSLSPFVSGRSIEVQINNNNLPSGIEIIMDVSSFSGSGAGIVGTSQGVITLSTIPQKCITNIGGSYTGNGPNNGHQLTYSLGISNYDELDAGQSTVIELMFTLVDN